MHDQLAFLAAFLLLVLIYSVFLTLEAIKGRHDGSPVPDSGDVTETIGTYARLIGLEVEHDRLEALLDGILERRRAEVPADGASRMAHPHRLVAKLERVFALERSDGLCAGGAPRELC